VGEDKIRYLWFFENRWRWSPTRKMRAAGFRLVTFSRELTAEDKARAIALNTEWDAVRAGKDGGLEIPQWPVGSIGEAYVRSMKLREKERRTRNILWTSEQKSRDDWPRAWRYLGPALGDCNPTLVTPEFMLDLRIRVANASSESEAHRTIKVWRALWVRMAGMGLCERDLDPSLQFANSAPAPRQTKWQHREVLRMVQRAWRMRYYGLAAVIATAWDTMLSSVDVRMLTVSQGARDQFGAVFFLDRAKTGRQVVPPRARSAAGQKRS
jgi:hypothetical protein